MRKVSIGLISLMMIVMMTGCQLAVPKQCEEKAGDKLIGIYVTDTYVNTSELQVGTNGEISFESKDNGRIYGKFDTKLKKITFDGIDGYLYAEVQMDEEHGPVYSPICHEAFHDVHINITDTSQEVSAKISYDESAMAKYEYYENDSCYDKFDKSLIREEMDMDGNVTGYEVTVQKGKELVLYTNPVYLTPDNQVYMVGENSGISCINGSSMGQSYTNTIEDTLNGVSRSKKESYSITIEGAIPTKQVTFQQYDSKDVLLQADTYEVQHLPKSYDKLKDTAYIIAKCVDMEGKLSWDVISAEEGFYNVYTATENLICVPHQVEIK